MLTNSSASKDRAKHLKQNINSESCSKKSDFETKNSSSTLLPRSAWNSNLAFLKAVFKAKKALDEVEFIENKSNSKL